MGSKKPLYIIAGIVILVTILGLVRQCGGPSDGSDGDKTQTAASSSSSSQPVDETSSSSSTTASSPPPRGPEVPEEGDGAGEEDLRPTSSTTADSHDPDKKSDGYKTFQTTSTKIIKKNVTTFSEEFSTHKSGWEKNVGSIVSAQLKGQLKTIDPTNIPDLGKVESVSLPEDPELGSAVADVKFSGGMTIRYLLIQDSKKWLIDSYNQAP